MGSHTVNNLDIASPPVESTQQTRRFNGPLWLTCGVAVTGILGFVLAPIVLSGDRGHGLARSPWILVQERALDTLAAGFLFWIGGCIGSFLNVVVFRIPRGLTILGRSRCPGCGHPIRPGDNIPILAWLRLRGRCRDCQMPISARYMWVELIVASGFLCVGLAEFGTGWSNLPNMQPLHYHDFAWSVLIPDWRMGMVYLGHISLFSTLVAATLIRLDGHRVPGSIWCVPMLFILGAHLASPAMHPVAWHEVHRAGDTRKPTNNSWANTPNDTILARLSDGAWGGLAGAVVFPLVSRSRRTGAGLSLSIHVAGVTGWGVGWQGLLTVWLLATVLRTTATFLMSDAWRWTSAVWLATWNAGLILMVTGWQMWHHHLWLQVPTLPLVAALIVMCWLLEAMTRAGEPMPS